ncbi:uncharacterized protein LOC123318829 [Coccinella septempunctata]|uniref:uncharacterized protein LOC123318829 n=1 Tax=Coccinella septempunctata TaxID=41139 RepID=UPI001D066FEF|nr:uncharacterized protein LOC123318829 [Coccinella septempunctata]
MVLLRGDLDEIRKNVSEQIQLTVLSEEFQNKLIESLLMKIEKKFDDRYKKIEDNVRNLNAEVESLRYENNNLRRSLDAQEQYCRNRNIRIFGLKQEKDENLFSRIQKIFIEKMNVEINSFDVEICHRVSSKGDKDGRPPAVLMQFRNVNTRLCLLKQRRLLKNTGVTMKEDLTQFRLRLYKVAVKELGGKNVWCLNGNIYGRIDGHSRRIEKEGDIPISVGDS